MSEEEKPTQSLKIKKQQRNALVTNIKKELRKGQELVAASEIDKIAANKCINILNSYGQRIGELDEIIMESIEDEKALADEVLKTEEMRGRIADLAAGLRAVLTQADAPSTASGQRRAARQVDMPDEDKRSKVNLPILQIQKFSGDPLKWQQFWDSFHSMIDLNDRLSPIEKQQYLRSYQTGSAQRLAEGLRMTNDTYALLVQRLQERFGDPEIAIFCHFDAMLSMQPAGRSASELQRVFDECESHIGSLTVLGLSEDTFGRVFTPIILSKLTQETRVELHRKKGQGTWTLQELRKLLKDEIYALEMSRHALGLGESYPAEVGKKSKGEPKVSTGFSLLADQDKKKAKQKKNKKCFFCGSTDHFSDQCKAFPDLRTRTKKVGDRCKICLKQPHPADKPCQNRRRCYFCKESGHHQSLCPSNFADDKSASTSQSGMTGGSHVSGKIKPAKADMDVAQGGGVAYLQTAVAEAEGTKRRIKVQIVLDVGATRSFIRTRIAKQMGARPLTSELISIGGFQDAERKTRRYQSYEFAILGRDGRRFNIIADGTDTVTPPADAYPTEILAQEHPILRKVTLAQPISGPDQDIVVDLLIGGDYYYDLILEERINCGKGLILLDSVFGYVAAGCVQRGQSGGKGTNLLVGAAGVAIRKPEFDLEKFWRLEEVGIQDSPGEREDQVAIDLFNQSVQFDEDEGRYMVKWPWRGSMYELSDNLGLSYGRLRSCLKRLECNKEHMKTYSQVIQTQFERGIIEEVPEQPDGSIVHYMPHHHVLNPESHTTPLRVVHDASSKPKSTAPSLNDCMYRGPALWEDLCGLLLRFRLHKIALMSDIEKAFLMIGLQKPDRDVTRFLWVRDTGKPATGTNLIHYRFTRVCFGVVASSFLLGATLTHHCQKVGTETAKDLLNNCYVDNIIGGKETIEGALRYCQEAKKILQMAGMNLREWYSNKKEVTDQLPVEDCGKGTVIKVLGLKWDIKTDTLICRIKKADNTFRADTKRKMLQEVSQLYDPCGYFAPVTLPGKIIIQQLWVDKRKWDERLPEKICKQWEDFQESMRKVPTFELSRKYAGFCLTSSTRNEIHCFCDASTKAYSAVVYLRATINGRGVTNLVFSKCRVSPVKKLTVPQLELVAVKVGSKLQDFVRNSLGIPVAESIIWTDSQCVLHWIMGKPVVPVFVRNRVKQIREYKGVTFRYVPTEENPADIPTRGMTFEELKNNRLWWHGPDWMQSRPPLWPVNPVKVLREDDDDAVLSSEESPERNAEAALVLLGKKDEFMDLSQYSCLKKLLHVTAYVFRFLERIRKKVGTNCEFRAVGLSVKEMQTALQFWIRRIQIRKLSQWLPGRQPSAKEKEIGRRHGISTDSDGILRCSGRLENAVGTPEGTRSPILLAKDDHLTDLIILDIHSRLLHAGVAHTLAELRTAYWIFHGRTQVKRVIKLCLLCQRQFGGPYRVPKMPSLPSFRVTSTDPFANIGIDYLGPLYIFPPGDVQRKVWICLFTCATSRAIHLEVIPDLTASEFLLGFRRHVAMHGRPSLVVSDNAKQFVSARNALDKVWSEICHDSTVGQYSQSMGVTWKFVVEYAPWMGGFYERMVGVVKKSLKVAIDKKRLTLEELQVTVYEVAAIVNRRPLLYLEDELDGEPLTPARLTARHRDLFPVVDFVDADPEVLAGSRSARALMLQWKRLQNRVKSFWDTWRRSYLQSLRERYRERQRNVASIIPRIGAPVIIHDELLPRMQWRMGIIESLIQSGDGEYRSAVVRLPGKRLVNRPLKKLYPLETEVDEVEVHKHDQGNRSEDLQSQITDLHLTGRPTRVAAQASREKTKRMLAGAE